MSKTFLHFLLGAFGFVPGIFGFGQSGGPASAPSRHVILITIDGMRPEFYLDPTWPAPNMQHLIIPGC